VDFPGARATSCFGINSSGEISGNYSDQLGTIHGFVDNRGSFQKIDFPHASNTVTYGINDSGDSVGTYNSGNRSYLKQSRRFASGNIPSAQETVATGINDNEQIVGYYVEGSIQHGFIASPK
jgi:hypothetical protein